MTFPLFRDDNPFQILSLGYVRFPVQYTMSVNCTLYFLLLHLLLQAMRLVCFLNFYINSVIYWPSSGFFFFFFSDNMIFVLTFLECPKLLIEPHWYFAFCSVQYLYASLGHYYSCSQVLVLHFCWQVPNLFFSTYRPSAGSPFAAWLSLWHSSLE